MARNWRCVDVEAVGDGLDVITAYAVGGSTVRRTSHGRAVGTLAAALMASEDPTCAYSVSALAARLVSRWEPALARALWAGECVVVDVGREHAVRLRLTPGHSLTLATGRQRCTVWQVSGFHRSPPPAPIDADRFERAAAVARWQGAIEAAVTPLCRRRPSRWDGPGAVAAELLRASGLPARLLPTDLEPEEALAAYYGGRVEGLRYGSSAWSWSLDQRGSYAWALSRLSDWSGVTRWDRAYDVVPESLRPGDLVRLRWWSADARGPLPVRLPSGHLRYPAGGEGWYWYPDVVVARSWGADMRVLERLRPVGLEAGDDQVLAWYERAYDYRRTLESTVAESALKSCLAATYGKLAQRPRRAGDEHRSGVRSLVAAGYATALVRERVVHEVTLAAGLCLQATDGGLVAAYPSAARIGERLGDMRVREAGPATICGPHLYWTDERAVSAQWPGLTREDVIRAWRDGVGEISAETPRLVTPPVAAQWPQLADRLGQVVRVSVTARLHPGQDGDRAPTGDELRRAASGLVERWPVRGEPLVSVPYDAAATYADRDEVEAYEEGSWL